MRFALAGNPNSGKTTLFNSLTGSTAHVGNWPGVTVDRKEGTYKGLSEPITIIDLPGIYSLSPYTPEEIITRDYVINDKPDLIINIVDATNLERNLYLTTQLLETDCPVIVALNMMDIIEKNGGEIDEKALGKALGVPIVPISALRSGNIKKLMEISFETAKVKRVGASVLAESYLSDAIESISKILQENGVTSALPFHAVKLLERDEHEIKTLDKFTGVADSVDKIRDNTQLSDALGGDFEAAVADARYKYISKYCGKTFKHSQKKQGETTSDKIDKILTNRLLGLPIFFLMMFGVFHLTFSRNLFFFTGLESPGVMFQTWTGVLVSLLSDTVANFLASINTSPWLQSLIVDGIIAGLDSVLSFIPQIMMLFFFLSLMEDSGYMSRAAFLMDRLLRRFGLSGKAFMPMLMGYGCTVPAIMATRTLESAKDRRLTIMLMVGFSCGAKLPIWSLFAAALFPENADLMIFAIYMLGIVFAVVAGILLKGTIFKGDAVPFIMELPAYHLPRAKNVFPHLWDKLRGFVIRAGTIIAASTIVIWFLANFNFSLDMVQANSAESILGIFGTALVPIFAPLGFASGPDGWKAVVAILTGIIAKEAVVSTMGILYNPGVEGDALGDETVFAALLPVIATSFSPLAAVSFMTFNLLCVPCMAACSAAWAELRSPKWFWFTIAFWLGAAYVVSFLVFNIGTLLGLGV